MDAKEAKCILKNPDGEKLSEIGEAIDVLLSQRQKSGKKGSYTKLSKEIGKERIKISGRKRSFMLSELHGIYRMPQGIRWKIDLEKIGASQGVEIARLKSEEEQWVLALAVDAKQMSVTKCKKIVSLVLRKPKADEKDYSLREALGIVSGIRFRDIPRVMEMLSPEEWIAVSKEAWNRKMDWQDFFHCLATEKQSVLSDMEKVAERISQWSRDFPRSSHEEMDQKLQSLAKIADELRQLAELRQPSAEETVQKPEAEEKEKPNGSGDSGKDPSISSEEIEAEKEADVQSGGDAPESPKPSEDGGSNPETEEKEKPNDVGDSGENPSVSSEEIEAEKVDDVQSGGDEPKSPKSSEDSEQLRFNDGDDKTKSKRKKKSAKKKRKHETPVGTFASN